MINSSQVIEDASFSELGFGELPPNLPLDGTRLAAPEYTA
jgi:hypothetical protein